MSVGSSRAIAMGGPWAMGPGGFLEAVVKHPENAWRPLRAFMAPLGPLNISNATSFPGGNGARHHALK
eukprot:1472260-Pyramimonas_sp.AAC.1